MEDEILRVFSKMDAFLFNYTDKESMIEGYITGKSIATNEERYVTNFAVNPKDIDLLDSVLAHPASIDERTIVIDYRLLTNEIIEILKKAYIAGTIAGIRVIPDDYQLTKEVFDRMNQPDFYGFLVAANSVSKEITESSKYLDIRAQKGLCQIEHLYYGEVDRYNIHITRKLSKEEIHSLASIIKEHSYQKILVDFYEPSYYRDLLEALKTEEISKEIQITFLGNPLYDEKMCYEGLEEIIENPITIHYNTCNDLNEMTRREPHTEGAKYYSDIEASGETPTRNYYDMIKMLDEIVEYMEEKNYSPLEKLAYLTDYFKKNFIYDPDSETTEHADNANLDKVFKKDRMICEGFSNFYSAILRRSGMLCFTYGTDNHQKNIVRIVDEKYGVDQIAIIDPTFDLSKSNNRNVFENFLIPLDSDMYAHVDGAPAPSVIDIPTSLMMSSEHYYSFINESNPVYATDPLGYAIRMLQLMGLGDNGMEMTPMERAEYYKSALARTHLTDLIPASVIAQAVHTVREREHEYGDEYESEKDAQEVLEALESRGFTHDFSPKIRLFDGTEIDVEDYKPSVEVDFVPREAQPMVYKKPRKKQENETNEDFYRYLREFYDTMFYRRYEETIDMKDSRENLEEFEVVEKDMEVPEIVIYRDMDDLGRSFVTEETLKRFHIGETTYSIKIDERTEVYEIRPQEAAYIIEHQNSKYAPYKVRFQRFDFKNELRDSVQEEIKAKQESADEIIIFRDANDFSRSFVAQSVLDRFNIPKTGSKVALGRMVLYEIDPIQAINIINNSNNKYAPYTIHYLNIEIHDEKTRIKKEKEAEEKKKYPDEIMIFRDVDNFSRSFVNQSVLNLFNIPKPKHKVYLGRMILYEVDPTQVVEIINQSKNPKHPFEIRYISIEMDAKKETKKEEKTEELDEVLIFRDVNDFKRSFVNKAILERFNIPKPERQVYLGRMVLYEIDPIQTLRIIQSADNKEHPFNIRYVSIEMDAKKEEKKEVPKEKEELLIFRDVHNFSRSFVNQAVLERFQIPKPAKKVLLGRMIIYEIDPIQTLNIIETTERKDSPYKLRFVSIEMDAKKEEKKPAKETEEVKDEILIFRDVDNFSRSFVNQAVLERFNIPRPNSKVLIGRMIVYEIDPIQTLNIIENANNGERPYSIRYVSIEMDEKKEKKETKTEEKPKEEIIIFRDVDDSGRTFVTQAVLDRFGIERPAFKVYLGKMIVYEINPATAIEIIDNCNNKENPYTIRYVSIEFDKEDIKKEDKEEVMPYQDDLTTVEEKVEGDEYIPGTNFKKPRVRRPYETDDHYVAYLEGYYDSIFGNDEEVVFRKQEPQEEVEKPRVRGADEPDEAYARYLENYYNSVFGEKKLSSRDVLRQRPKRPDETDEEYIEYLAMFYGTPVEEEQKTGGRTK